MQYRFEDLIVNTNVLTINVNEPNLCREWRFRFENVVSVLCVGVDLSTARRANQEQKRINVDFPSWVVDSLDREAARVGVTRQSIIKVWLVERLKVSAASKPLKSDVTSGSS